MLFIDNKRLLQQNIKHTVVLCNFIPLHTNGCCVYFLYAHSSSMAAWLSIGEFSMAKHPYLCLPKMCPHGSAAIHMGLGAKEMAGQTQLIDPGEMEQLTLISLIVSRGVPDLVSGICTLYFDSKVGPHWVTTALHSGWAMKPIPRETSGRNYGGL